MARPDITELGESLLSGKIERVRRQEKRAEKDQRKALLMGLGLQLGAGAVQSFFNKKVNDFSQNERILQAKARINSIQDQQTEWRGIKDRIVKSDMSQEDYFINQTKDALLKQYNYESLQERLSPQKFKEFQEMIEQRSRTEGLERSSLFDKAGKELADVVDADSFDAMVEKLNTRPKNLGQATGNLLKRVFTGRDDQALKEEEALTKLHQMGFIESAEFDVAMKQFRKHGTLEAANKAANLVEKEGTWRVVAIDLTETHMAKTAKVMKNGEWVTVTTKVDYDDPEANKRAIDEMLVDNLKRVFNNSLNEKGQAAWMKITANAEDLTKNPEALNDLTEQMMGLLENDEYVDAKKSSNAGLEYQRVLQSFSAVLSSRERIYAMDPNRLIIEVPIIWQSIVNNDMANLMMKINPNVSKDSSPNPLDNSNRKTTDFDFDIIEVN
jgi:hypothetical protein